ncbi:hypothetical protein TNCV_2649861 [Trichonephila clavipes]|nr:hypothetical protein TNCV_2649861 [Trichonephila clavipes]
MNSSPDAEDMPGRGTDARQFCPGSKPSYPLALCGRLERGYRLRCSPLYLSWVQNTGCFTNSPRVALYCDVNF